MFAGWDSFYLMLGGAAASLIGLLFVVVTLTHSLDRERAQRGAGVFLTPTVIHFASALVIGAVAVAPRLPLAAVAAVAGLVAAVGLGNSAWAAFSTSPLRSSFEVPHWSDFWLYGMVPVALYLLLGAADVALMARRDWAPPALAAVLLALLLVGVRNAWDLVNWIAPKRDAPPS